MVYPSKLKDTTHKLSKPLLERLEANLCFAFVLVSLVYSGLRVNSKMASSKDAVAHRRLE